MALTINTNVASLNAQRNLSTSQTDLNRSMQRLSSGLRINSAKDDAAGLAISDRMTAQIRGLNQAVRNANDGISLAQVAEGAMQESTNLLQRMRELAVQSANATNSSTDRASLQAEVNQLQLEMNRIASNTNFNGLNILDGTFLNQSFQVGADANQTISISISGVSTSDLGRYTVDGSNATVDQGTGSVTDSANTLPAANTIASQSLSITGTAGSATVSVGAGDTAQEIAAAINAEAGTTNVKAEATTKAYLSSLTNVDNAISFSIGSGDTLTAVSSTATTLSALAEDINAEAGKTGISAAYDAANDRIELTQSEGADIKIANFAEGGDANGTISLSGAGALDPETLTTGGADSAVVAGTLEIYSTDSFVISSSVADSAGSVLNVAADTGATVTNDTVSSIDISTIEGANSAISIVDAALSKIDSLRGDLGAVQNRFESTISNLSNVSENLSAARSRILDADIAMETSEMTKQNILQQAGVSILAQANQAPQLALSLLG